MISSMLGPNRTLLALQKKSGTSDPVMWTPHYSDNPGSPLLLGQSVAYYQSRGYSLADAQKLAAGQYVASSGGSPTALPTKEAALVSVSEIEIIFLVGIVWFFFFKGGR